jgi:hypothetical protein
LPHQWNGGWIKKERVAFFKKAMKWSALSIEKHNIIHGEHVHALLKLMTLVQAQGSSSLRCNMIQQVPAQHTMP